MDVDRKSLFFVLLANQLVHLFDILVLASVGGTKNTTDKDGVFVDWYLIMSNCDVLEKVLALAQVNELLGVSCKLVLLAIPIISIRTTVGVIRFLSLPVFFFHLKVYKNQLL